MFLYFNGDSFVQGVELGDDILPDYPGLSVYKPPYQVDKDSLSYKWFLGTKKSRLAYLEKIDELQKKRCFAGIVEKITKLPTINNARGAASMDRISRTTVHDLIKYKKIYSGTKIKAFIGTTNIQRFEIGCLTEFKTNSDMWWRDVSTIWSAPESLKEELEQALLKYKIMFETDYHQLMNFYKNAIYIQEFCKSNDIDLYWIAVNFNHYSSTMHDYSNHTDLLALMEYANISPIIDMNEIAKSMTNKKILCPSGHYGQPVHDFIAHEIIKIINGIEKVSSSI